MTRGGPSGGDGKTSRGLTEPPPDEAETDQGGGEEVGPGRMSGRLSWRMVRRRNRANHASVRSTCGDRDPLAGLPSWGAMRAGGWAARDHLGRPLWALDQLSREGMVATVMHLQLRYCPINDGWHLPSCGR